MPTYVHRCPACGEFELVRPMAESDRAAHCPVCGAAAARLFGAPGLNALDPGLRRALDTSAASADAPHVVGAVPGRHRRATRTTRDPRHARLPRP